MNHKSIHLQLIDSHQQNTIVCIKLTCKIQAFAFYEQCPDTTTSLLPLQLYTSSTSVCHWSYHTTGCSMQTCKCRTCPYLAKWVPVTGHWLFQRSCSSFQLLLDSKGKDKNIIQKDLKKYIFSRERKFKSCVNTGKNNTDAKQTNVPSIMTRLLGPNLI